MNPLALTWALCRLPPGERGRPAGGAYHAAAPRPGAATRGRSPAGLAFLAGPAGRSTSRLGHRACGPHPLAARPPFASGDDGPIAVPTRRGGPLATSGRNPVLRC